VRQENQFSSDTVAILDLKRELMATRPMKTNGQLHVEFYKVFGLASSHSEMMALKEGPRR
jgi:hypothetical protein